MIEPGDGRAFLIYSQTTTATVTIRGLRVEGARIDDQGAAVNNTEVLTLEDCTFAGNESRLANGGAISNYGALTLTRCAVMGNKAGARGGGIYHTIRSLPAAMESTCTITDCTISGNTAGYNGGGISAFYSRVPMLVRNSTISDNTAEGDGGGISNIGGTDFELTVEGCTISDNRARRGGGVYNLNTDAVLDGTAVTGNTADVGMGGGLFQDLQGSTTLSGDTTVNGNVGGNCAGSQIVEDGGTCTP